MQHYMPIFANSAGYKKAGPDKMNEKQSYDACVMKENKSFQIFLTLSGLFLIVNSWLAMSTGFRLLSHIGYLSARNTGIWRKVSVRNIGNI